MSPHEFLAHWTHRLADLFAVPPGVDMNAASLQFGHQHHDALHELTPDELRLVVKGWRTVAGSAEMLAQSAQSVLEVLADEGENDA